MERASGLITYRDKLSALELIVSQKFYENESQNFGRKIYQMLNDVIKDFI